MDRIAWRGTRVEKGRERGREGGDVEGAIHRGVGGRSK
jgi:hypothetical protein